MGFTNAIKAQIRWSPDEDEVAEAVDPIHASDTPKKPIEQIDIDDAEVVQKPTHRPDLEGGVARVEAVQAVWGKYGKKIIIIGLAMMMIM